MSTLPLVCHKCGDQSTHVTFGMRIGAYDDPVIDKKTIKFTCQQHAKEALQEDPELESRKLSDVANEGRTYAMAIGNAARKLMRKAKNGEQDEDEDEDNEETGGGFGSASEMMLPEEFQPSKKGRLSTLNAEFNEDDEHDDSGTLLERFSTEGRVNGGNPAKSEITDFTKFQWDNPEAHFNAWQQHLVAKRKHMQKLYAQSSRAGEEPAQPGRKTARNAKGQSLVTQYDLRRIQDQLGIEWVDFDQYDAGGYPDPQIRIKTIEEDGVPTRYFDPAVKSMDLSRIRGGMFNDRKSTRQLTAIREYEGAGGDRNTDFENSPAPFVASHYAPADPYQIPLAKEIEHVPCGYAKHGCTSTAKFVAHTGTVDRGDGTVDNSFLPVCKDHKELLDRGDLDFHKMTDDEFTKAFEGKLFGRTEASIKRMNATAKHVYPIAVKFHQDFGLGNPVTWHKGRAVFVNVVQAHGKDEQGKNTFYWIPTNHEPVKNDGSKISEEEMRGLDLYREHQTYAEKRNSSGPLGTKGQATAALQSKTGRVGSRRGVTSELSDIFAEGGRVNSVSHITIPGMSQE